MKEENAYKEISIETNSNTENSIPENERKGWMTTRTERADYGLYLLGQNVIYTLVSNFLSTYLPMCGIDNKKSAPVLLVVKAWDAINDIVFGGIFDKVKFKKGKFMPWIRISLIFIPLATILMFSIPSFGGQVASRQITYKLFWFAIMYIFWDTAYTLCDVPIYGLITTMTNNLQERTAIMSNSKLYSGVGTIVAYVLGTVLVSQSVGLSYTFTAIICSLAALAVMVPISHRGKERNYLHEDKEQSFTFKEMLMYMARNKYLLIFYGAFIINGCLNTSVPLGMFVSYYLFDNELFNLILGALAMIPTAIFAILMPKIIARIDKYTLFFWGSLLSVVMGLVIFLVGYENKILFLTLSVIKAIPASFPLFLVFMFTPDCAEYGQYKTGSDAKGITFAIQTFSAKFTSSISTSLGMWVVGVFGFISYSANSFAELKEMGATQTPEVLRGLWLAYALIPVIGGILQMILLLFYKLNDKDVQIMSDYNSGVINREQAEASLSRKY